MIVHNDGRFEIAGLPRNVFYSGDLNGAVVNSSAGKWKVGKSTEGQKVLDIIFYQANGVEKRLPFSFRLFLATQQENRLLPTSTVIQI
jgi:hypothetical protein